MSKSIALTLGLLTAAIFLTPNAGSADFRQDMSGGADQDRLLIVNGNTGRVVYDDGHNDLFCVTRRVIMGYTEYGRPIRKRTMHCR